MVQIKKEWGEWPCKTLLPDYDVVKVLVDKGAMTDILEGTDLVPKSYLIDPANINYEELEQLLTYPFDSQYFRIKWFRFLKS